jgi:hypothetical protein
MRTHDDRSVEHERELRIAGCRRRHRRSSNVEARQLTPKPKK